ncbi:MAG: hypothetical protein M3270_08290 [Thermoproteota archaeon]|nr:hypothetical protein [Thermoproteota archaeon]
MVEKKNEGQEEENNNNYTKVKAARPDEQYLDLTSGKEREDLRPLQETCDICGLTARNKDELEEHINNAH